MARSSIPAWQRKLHIRKTVLINSIKTENFTYLHIQAVLAQNNDTTEPSPHAVDDIIEREIKNLNITLAEENEAAFAGYKNETESLEGDLRAASEWTRRMLSAKDSAKADLCNAVDNTFHNAESIITNLPHHKQVAAFDLFAVGQNFVSQAFDWCVTEMNNVVHSIVDFMKGNWTAMHAAWNTIREGVNTIIDWIKGIFGSASNSSSSNGALQQQSLSAPAPVDQLDVRIELIWLGSPMMSEHSIKMALLYLHGQFDRALARHVEMGSAFQQGLVWHATVTVPGVDVLSISDVISTLKEVVKVEHARREALPGHPHVPTPDPVSLQNPSAVAKGTEPPKKSEVVHIAPLTPIRLGGRSRHMSAQLSPSRVYAIVD